MSQRFARNPSEWLEQQLEELSGLRNAGARSPEFKTWRQGTLTVIQRIWPGDATRSERFRRIPFSAPSSRAEAREARECFERGCAEATSYLRQLRKEIGDGAAGEATVTTTAAFDPGTQEDDFPTVELPGGGEAPSFAAPPPLAHEVAPPLAAPPPLAHGATPPPITPDVTPLPVARDVVLPPVAPVAPPARHASSPPAPEPPAGQREIELPPASATPSRDAGSPEQHFRTSDIPRLPGARVAPERAADAAPLPSAAPPALGLPVAPPADQVQERAAEPRTKAAKGMKKNGVKARLKDLLGLNETLMQGASIEPEPPASAPAPPAPRAVESAAPHQPAAPPPAAPPPAPAPAPVAERAPTPFTPPAPAPPAPVAEHAPTPFTPPAPAARTEAHDANDRTTTDFLDASPVLSSRPRPAPRRNAEPAPPASSRVSPHASPLALEIQALADVVAELGVPEGQRAHARAALLDLARQINSNELSWNVLRETVAFLMDYPPLARRVLPILLPCLDEAA